MRRSVWSFMIAVVTAFAAEQAFAQANQDIYVDLSVLDELSAGSVSSYAQPMFPVVEKKAVKPVVKAKKKVAKKVVVRPKKTPVTIIKPAQIVEPKDVAVREENSKRENIKKDIENQIFAAAPAEKEDVVLAAPVAPVKEEILPAEKIAEVASPLLPSENQTASEGNVLVKDADTSPKEDAVENVVVVDVEPISFPVQTKEPEPVAAESLENSVRVDKAVDLVPSAPKETSFEKAETVQETGNSLHFSGDSSDLTMEHQEQIDRIVMTFENPQVNKISILSYNVNDGVDTFRKKRLSLNRAVDVRSYLLQKGYKNFSIKVVNVESGSDKADTVELAELK